MTIGINVLKAGVSPDVTLDITSSRLPLLSARPMVTFPALEHHQPSKY